MSKVRLACWSCDRDDHDGIDEVPESWADVEQVQTYEESVRVYEDPEDEPPGYSILDWYTHLGTCPVCLAEEAAGRPLTNKEILILKIMNEMWLIGVPRRGDDAFQEFLRSLDESQLERFESALTTVMGFLDRYEGEGDSDVKDVQ